jgi:hypothetical protein
MIFCFDTPDVLMKFDILVLMNDCQSSERRRSYEYIGLFGSKAFANQLNSVDQLDSECTTTHPLPQ